MSAAKNIVPTAATGTHLNIFLRSSLGSSVLVSVDRFGLGGGDGDSHSPSYHSNAIVFASEASNLVAGDTNAASDIFLRDLIANRTLLISEPFDGQGSAYVLASLTNASLCDAPQISADARWVAFQSRAQNLVALLDFNQAADIFVRDLRDNITVLVSVNMMGTGPGNGASDQPSLSAAGNRVAFVSRATDLNSQPNSRQGDVYVRDLLSGQLLWASRNAWLDLGARSFSPQISEQGQQIIFFAASLAPATNTFLLYHDLQTGLTQIVRRDDVDTATAQLSADGRYVAYAAAGQVFLWDSTTGQSEQVSVELPGSPVSHVASRPAMSADASVVAFLGKATNHIAQFYVRNRAQGSTALASIGVDGLPNRAGLDSFFPALSRDGRWLAFESSDPLLVAGDGNHAPDIFRRDLQTEHTVLISARGPNLPALTGSGRSLVWPSSVSHDGRRVAFTSHDTDLSPNDENGFADGFVYDLTSGEARAVSGQDSESGNQFVFQTNGVIHSPVLSGNGEVVAYVNAPPTFPQRSTELINGTIHCVNLTTGQRVSPLDQAPTQALLPALSPDGRWLTYAGAPQSTQARRLLLAELNEAQPIARVISRSFDSSGPASGDCTRSQFSPNGELVLFLADSANLTAEPRSGYQLYSYSMAADNVTLVSRATSSEGFLENINGFVISGNSRFVAFQLPNSRRIFGKVLTAPNQPSELICTNCSEPSLSRDGQWVAYSAQSATSPYTDIYLQDRVTRERILISSNLTATAGGNGDSFLPSVSPNGAFVVFASRASDLVGNDANRRTDVFLRDLRTQSTLLLSINSAGSAAGNNLSSSPVLSLDGRTVIFGSFASDLVLSDYNQTRDIFVVQLAAADGDGDQMDDDWELAYFETRDRDGHGDFDQDGQSDLNEFQAGTDPTNQSSVLRVITVHRMGLVNTTVLWTATPLRSYQVQYRDSVDAAEWTTFPEIVTAQSSTASYVDTSASGVAQRFYRVVLVP